jgi:NAD(P)-dependent dehydrogenase (short-subunit alcohol dehydrogenase family)
MTEDRQVVVVTGVSRGLGTCIVKELLKEGFSVIGHVRSESQRDALLASCAKYNLKELSVVFGDLSNRGEVEALSASIKAHCSRIDVLINNAGVFSHAQDGNLEELSLEFFYRAVEVNLVAPVCLTINLMPLLKRAARGMVVNILTDLISNNTMDGTFPAYRASKAALATITQNQASGTGGICIIGIDPGWMRTDMGGANAPDDPSEVAIRLVRLLKASTKIKSGLFYKGLELVSL